MFEHKKQYLPLLLLADEQESMIDRYLDRGALYALYDGGLKAVCVVTDEGNRVLEVKNLAVDPAFHRMGYASRMLDWICAHYRAHFDTLLVGTGDSPLTLPFYERCGFVRAYRVPGFFTAHYDHPIFEAGRQLVDMLYLKKPLS